MFYSEALLQKTGPLARVWLSANLERKLSKTHILQSSVKDSVDAIVNPSQAPMALRLSGQLLLGVVRIYSRKARYLLDDCNEALVKIKMAFRLSSNNDLPAGLHIPSRDALMLPDVLTEGDNLEMPPLPDASFLLSQMDDDLTHVNRKRRAGSRDINLNEDFGNSQFLQSSVLEGNKYNDEDLALDPDDLDLDLDLGLDVVDVGRADRSLEFGRDAPAAGSLADAIGDSDLNILSKDGLDSAAQRGHSISIAEQDDDGFRIVDDDGDINMAGADMTFDIGEVPDAPLATGATLARARISESPLSDIDPDYLQNLDNEQRNLDSTIFDETEQPIERRPAQRARKLKVLQADEDTVIPAAVIRAQQQDHSKIIRPQSFLPRDPMLYALMEMQRNGGFVSNIMGDGRSAGWAPELRGMLSLDAITKAQSLKRKRDSGIADMDGREGMANKSPKITLELGEEEDADVFGAPDHGREDTVVQADGTIIELGDADGFRVDMEEDEGFAAPVSREGSVPGSPNDNTFDVTTAPLIHPEDNGPVSLGTKHAVHLLRDQFGSEAANSPDKRKKASVLFQDLLPERTTSRADATKMFFEVLVLATKDAVKVEQKDGVVGGPIRVRGKRGLWGSWAETEAGGEIAEGAVEGVPVATATVGVEA
ncbi:MAG: sister chromatid cohesion protein 1 [Claussenomyces sp. TS43310]|nr:MAG: sister chromatid cohesion protein 1 [Claussenomyces sp. TS43310]